jgi:hypothetical protein
MPACRRDRDNVSVANFILILHDTADISLKHYQLSLSRRQAGTEKISIQAWSPPATNKKIKQAYSGCFILVKNNRIY